MKGAQRHCAKEQLNIGLRQLRRKVLKGLALVERARVKFLRLTEKPREALARHPVSPLLYMVVLALIIGTATFRGMYTQAFMLSVDGVEVGMVADEAEVEFLISQVETRAASLLGENFSYDAQVELTPALTTVDGMEDSEWIEDQMFTGAGALMDAWAISVDGVEMGYAATKEDMEVVLRRVAGQYMDFDSVGFEFVEKVEIFPVELPANTEFKLNDLYLRLTAPKVEEDFYEVKTGDTFYQIAYDLDMSPIDLSDLNQDIDINMLTPGQFLKIRCAEPFLSVRVFNEEARYEMVESPVEYIETPDLYKGETKLKIQGESGLAHVQSSVVYVDGYEVERTINEYQVIREATTTYMYSGTTPKPRTASTGSYIWPVRGQITSGYGGRNLGGYEFHRGIDIGGSYGTPIVAADGGTVTFSGWKGSYGYLVVITHDNGQVTYYGHNSSLLVKTGDKVYQGQTIAKMGSTGNSTGNHCHFEIRINGRVVNPMLYL